MAQLPTPSPSTPSPSSSAPARQIVRSSLPTPSRTTPTDPPEQQQSSSSTSSRLPSPQQYTSSRSRTSREGTPSDNGSADSARMPPPPARTTRAATAAATVAATAAAAAAGTKERTFVRRTAGTRDLKEKEKSDKDKGDEGKTVVPKRSMSLRSSTKRTSISARGEEKKEESAVLPKRNLRSRTVSTSTNASSSATERKTTASTAASSRIAAAPRSLRERSGTATAAATGTTTSRRPLSMYADTTSATSTGPRRAAAPAPAPAPAAAPARTHRRNQSTPSTAVQPPVRPGTSASTASNVSKSRRPPFSTLQQNFAAPPPPPTSRRSMPPPPLDPATIHQQTQLLQHSCLYANSHSTYAQLTASATAKLKRRFDTLAREHSKSREQLARRQRLLDIAGLVAVVETPAAGITGKRRETMRSPEEKIQAFSEAIKKLESLQQNEHRLLSAAFGEWIAGYSTPSPRRGIEQGGWVKKRGRWIDGLGEDWRRQCLFTSRRIETAVRAIESVVAAVVMEEELGVVSVVSERWMEVAKGMLEESQGMMLVEGNVVQRERRALEEVVAGAAIVETIVDDTVADAEERPVWV